MDTTGYIINSVLVLLVVRQIREHPLDLRSLIRPVALVVVAAVYYLHTIPVGGNDLLLEGGLAATGAAMGALCAFATHLRLEHGTPLARAGVLAAGLWVGGVGARMAFAYAAGHGFAPAIQRFSGAHSITGASAWVAALILMALADVSTRLVTLQLRGRNLRRRASGVGGNIVFA